jgi:hypothetical protein
MGVITRQVRLLKKIKQMFEENRKNKETINNLKKKK